MRLHAAPIPRVPRSGRDDRYRAGHPPEPKRAASAVVTSVQTDTVAVSILGEEVTGVVPLGAMPPVGAICEVESRGELLVIPLWFEGPPVPVIVELPALNITAALEGSPAAQVVGGPGALSTRDPASYVRMDSTANDWSFRVGYDDTGTPVEGFGLWEPPPGATLISSVFIAEGYRHSSGATAPFPQDDYDNAPSGTAPVITSYPFVVLEMSGASPLPTISTFPLDTPGEAAGQGTGFSPEFVSMRPSVYMATYPFPIVPMGLTLTYLAVRLAYTE